MRLRTLFLFYSFLGLLNVVFASKYYNESLTLRPLPRNKLLASFDFSIKSLPIPLEFEGKTSYSASSQNKRHFSYFPMALGPIIESTNTRELHLRFAQGWWDPTSWGKLITNGHKCGGTGVEISSVIEADSPEEAKKSWMKLCQSLSGFFCASFDSIDDSITTVPRYAAKNVNDFVMNPQNNLYLFRAALPSEPICTENLTPFLKLLPTRGKAGISSLLDGHKLFDGLWHGMSIDLETDCSSGECRFELTQSINTVLDVMRSLRKNTEGAIPKPTPGNKLLCDTSKKYDLWQCFPLGDPRELEWDLGAIFGRKIKGSAFDESSTSSVINVDVDSKFWDVTVLKGSDHAETLTSYKKYFTSYDLREPEEYNVNFKTKNSSMVTPVKEPPITVSRSLTGYSQDQGGIRVVFFNPSTTESISFIYFESLPWFMRLYLNTMKVRASIGTKDYHPVDESTFIKDRFYEPSIDRMRPSHIELNITLPPMTNLLLTYDFDKSLLLYAEYPPDANHGFAIEPAIVSVFNKTGESTYEFRTTSLLLSLPTPDFSMPYNVIILTCTVMSLAFGSIFNLLTKKVVTEDELETLSKGSTFGKRLRSKILGAKSKITGTIRKMV
ncbi:uncharacterized protein PRCAT00000379001 [Priceomyces carsonii]|uniref:uncharacterized protein n=1 Tax=Priceomyces carsonii TaxID=28549 RepID=UPI002ED86881|nr:unnamed protein product [Priceomyces carsonii]